MIQLHPTFSPSLPLVKTAMNPHFRESVQGFIKLLNYEYDVRKICKHEWKIGKVDHNGSSLICNLPLAVLQII